MTAQPAPAWTSHSTQSAEGPARLIGVRLRLTQGAWLGVSALSIALFVASVPVYFSRLRSLSLTHFPYDPELLRVGLPELGVPVSAFATLAMTAIIISVTVFVGVGLLIFWRRPDDPAALLSSAVLIMFGVIWPNTLADLGDAFPALVLPTSLVTALGFAGFFLLFYLFPDGRFVPRWTWPLGVVFVIEVLLHDLFPETPLNIDTWPAPLNLLPFIFPITFIYAQIHRYRKVSTPLQRQQTKWVLFGLIAAVTCFIGYGALGELSVFRQPGSAAALYVTGGYLFLGAVFLLVPITIGFAVLRYRLWDIDPIVNRTIVYGALTAGVIAIYILIVGWLSIAFQAESNIVFSLIATGLVAVLFQPLRQRLQRLVDRFMYGERDEPYAVVSRLGQRLEDTFLPDAVMPVIVETITDALRSPYAAIVLGRGETSAVAAASGSPVGDPVRIPLVYQHKQVGELLIAPRSPEEAFSSADHRLLQDLARQVGIVAHAVRLTEDLQRARERLVETREEERRRLRRELHDGLGSDLAALNMELGTLQRTVQDDPDAAHEQIRGIRAELRSAISEVRQIAHNLRPPALDDLGLRAALQARVARYESDELEIDLDLPEDLPQLSAAVEAAVYRIVEEALTNVVRHAHARRCLVGLFVDESIELTITDDGIGLDGERGHGVGLLSIRERAEELGGSAEIGSGTDGGTRIQVHLPHAKR